MIHAALRRAGLPQSALPCDMSELEAVRACALEWAPGNVLALPVHSPAARARCSAVLSR